MSDTVEQVTESPDVPDEVVQTQPSTSEHEENVEQTESDDEEGEEEEQLVIKRAKYNRLQRDLRIARSQAAYAERLQQQAAQERQPQYQPQNAQNQAVSEIDPAKYNSVEEYTAAVVKRTQEITKAEARQEFEREQSQNQSQREAKALIDSFQKKAAKVSRDIPDAVEAFEHLDTLARAGRFADGVGRALLESDLSPQIMSALYNDPDLLDKVMDKPLATAMKEIWKLEVRLESQPKAEPAKLRPTGALKGGYQKPRDLNDPNMSMDEFSKKFDTEFLHKKRR
ncbi:hypothetical protein UFOVP602_37 [uncultured Caudovirales phage]|uniref:Scaffolding protein n=1 Tax=uncultured Caudovirales phage TaxID=2100421 RepID=A0A6J5N4T5_9CAUD|nr:hypothetical protein UFOVP602_37 [uncultured Caudovirales phage]